MKRFKSHSEDHGTEVLRFDFIRAAIRVHRKVFTRKDSRVSVIRAFTLLELLIVISIIAILAATIVPNFIGFDTEARLSATKTNLSTLQTRVSIFRAKEGRYPERLEELTEVTYMDMGVEKAYLDYIPLEFVSATEGMADVENMTSNDRISGDGGWVYFSDKARVIVDWDEPLGSKWDKAEGDIPSEW